MISPSLKIPEIYEVDLIPRMSPAEKHTIYAVNYMVRANINRPFIQLRIK